MELQIYSLVAHKNHSFILFLLAVRLLIINLNMTGVHIYIYVYSRCENLKTIKGEKNN